jgi:hypothetical protein
MEAAESIGVGSQEWALAHEALSKLRLKRAGLDADEGTWLLRAFRAAAHVYFGYASFGEYIERLFGLSRRATEEKLRVAEALEELPALSAALHLGKLNWSVVRELSRVAMRNTEREWVAAAHGRTAREVERLVSGLARGDRPTDRRRPACARHVLRLEVGAETLATFREAMRVLRKRSDQRLDDDAALLSMAREILGGPREPGRASYQVVVTQCEECGRGFQHANGELIELDPAIVEMCHCDAQTIHVSHLHGVTAGAPDDRGGNADQLAKSRTHAGDADQLTKTQTHAGDADQLTKTQTHAGDADQLARGDAHPVRGARVAPAALKRQRARQETPPAIRREVFRRDRGRCVVPGCRNATYVDLHHLDLRSEGGSNDPDNLIVLCAAHHRVLHQGRLRIDGTVSTGLRIQHADGTAYGVMPSPSLAAASARAFAGLRNLGFSERTARVCLERALSGASANATAETLLRSAVASASCR